MAKKSADYYLRTAQDGGCKVKFGSKHSSIYPPPGVELPPNLRVPLQVPHELKGNGTECVIVKWLKLAGILVILWVVLSVAL